MMRITSSRTTRRRFLAGAGTTAALAPVIGWSSRAHAAWPTDKPIRIVIPFAVGGPPDIVARVIAPPLGEALGASVIIENKAGAGGNIGISTVARSDPDGYTLLVCSSAFMLNPSLFDNVPYDALADFVGISEMATSPNVFSVDPKLGINTIADLIAYGRNNPEKLTYASPGAGTTPALSCDLLRIRGGFSMPAVVFTGAGPAVQSVLSSSVPVTCTALPPSHPHIVSGGLKALAVTGTRRWADLPDVPTMKEAGFDNFVHETVNLMWAPAKTPPTIVERLAREMSAIMQRPAVRDVLQKGGYEVLGGDAATVTARVTREVPMWREVVAQTGIRMK